MKKKYVKIMFMSAVLLAGNVADANATLPKDDPKEAVQAPTDDHLPLLMINGTNKSVSFIVSSEALPGKDIKITAPHGFTVSPVMIPANTGKHKVTVTLYPFLCKSKRVWNSASGERYCIFSCIQRRK